MIIGNPSPLTLASAVLKPSTIEAVRQSSSYTLTGWKILDRWAFNSPQQLRLLEQTGEMLLLERLLVQQDLEAKALRGSQQALQEGLTEMEILQQHEIQTELL
ncbi:hypothetical protein [Achromobacter insuavis]|uniref:hypothetical protein n=1 Tax=Achromobacter insuavis TaxID=1287735 RepID=UPI001F1328E0|nr:hypothetical protein [Achromobacter insuavis]